MVRIKSKKGKGIIVKISKILTIMALMVVSVYGITKATQDRIQILIDSNPDIDIVLTIGETNINAENFERDVFAELQKRGIDTDRVRIQAIETKSLSTDTASASEIFSSWSSRTLLPSESTTQLYLGNHVTGGWSTSGTRVSRETGNTRPARAWINQEADAYESEDADISFTWGIDTVNYGSFAHGEAGFLFGIEDDRNFYAYIMDNHSACGHIRINGGEALIKVTNGSISQLASSTGFPMYSVGAKHDIDIQTKGNKIEVIRNGNRIFSVTDSSKQQIKGTYGFYVFDQYGAYFQDITIETQTVRDFGEVIRQPEWRDGSDRYVVNLNDAIVPDFDDPIASGEILTRLINEEIHYVGVGSTTNKKQTEDFINRINGNGDYVQGSNYTTALDNIVKYVEDQSKYEGVDQEATEEEYVIQGNDFDIKVIPDSLRRNTQNAEYPNGRWRIDHEYEFYDNNLGQAEWANQWQRDLQLDTDKPGRYEIFFGDQNPEPRYLYVHRRPIADFGLSVVKSGSNYNVTVNDLSYDPDGEYQSNKGIVEREWKWKRTTDLNWTNGSVPKTITAGQNYVVQLRVKDEQGEWSIPVARYITTENVIVQPVANFNVTPNPVSMYETLTVNDNSYDPAGREISAREWTVRRDGTQVYKGATMPTSFRSYGEGNYTIDLRVRNNANLWSETYRRPLTVTGDDSAPSATVTPVRVGATQDNIKISATYADTGGSGFYRQRYALTSSNTKPTSGWSSWATSTTRTVDVVNEGTYYLHLEATDNANNLYTRTTGEYVVDRTKPVISFGTNGNSNPKKDHSTKVSITDTGSRITSSSYQWTLSEAFPTTGKWTEVENGDTVKLEGLTGNYYLHVKATDEAGNEQNVTSKVFRMDNVAPVKPTLSQDTEEWTRGDVVVTIHYPEDASVKEYKVGTGGVWGGYTRVITLTNNNSVFARARDLAGNISTESSLSVTNIDKVKPTIEVTGNPTSWVEEGRAQVTIKGNDTQSGVDFITLPDGSKEYGKQATFMVTQNKDYTFVVTDKVGNEISETITVNMLMIPYTTKLVDSKGEPIEGATLELLRDGTVYKVTVSDDKGVADFGMIPPRGRYTVRLVKTPEGDTIEKPEEIEVDVTDNVTPGEGTPEEGTIPPITMPVGEELEDPEITQNPTEWVNTDITVTISYPQDANIKNYKVGNGEWTEYTGEVTITGNDTIYAKAYDVNGNWSPTANKEVTNIDKTSPSIEITPETSNWVGKDIIVNVNVTDDASGIVDVTSSEGLEELSREQRGNGYNVQYKVTENGNYTFETTDVAGNETTETVNINNLDKTKPTINITGNPTEWHPEDTATLEITTDDSQSGVNKVILPDGSELFGYDAKEFTYEVNDNGDYKFIVIDNVGNELTHVETITKMRIDYALNVRGSDGRGISGAQFELYRNGSLYREATSGTSGNVDFGSVPTSGKYEVRQTKVVNGYRLNNKTRTVNVLEQGYTIINYLKSEELPSTGTIDGVVIGLTSLVGLVGVGVVKSKRKDLEEEK